MERIESTKPHETPKPLRVLLVDDFPPFRQALASHLDGAFELCGEANDGNQAIQLARTLHPDVIVMDNRMQERNGISAIGSILDTHPKAAIFITSLSFERNYVLRAFVAGARGYIAKDDAVQSLKAIARVVPAGLLYLSPSVSKLIEQTAPPSPSQLSRQVLAVFDREAPALLECAHRTTDPTAADAALTTVFLAYWAALRKSIDIPDPQTWLLLSLAALVFPGNVAGIKRWSFFQEHPGGRALRQRTPRLLEHVSSCRACHLAQMLASYDPRAVADPARSRTAISEAAKHPDETALFLAFAERQTAVMRVAASELQVLLGSDAGAGWIQREVSASTWLGALMGHNPSETRA